MLLFKILPLIFCEDKILSKSPLDNEMKYNSHAIMLFNTVGLDTSYQSS